MKSLGNFAAAISAPVVRPASAISGDRPPPGSALAAAAPSAADKKSRRLRLFKLRMDQSSCQIASDALARGHGSGSRTKERIQNQQRGSNGDRGIRPGKPPT